MIGEYHLIRWIQKKRSHLGRRHRYTIGPDASIPAQLELLDEMQEFVSGIAIKKHNIHIGFRRLASLTSRIELMKVAKHAYAELANGDRKGGMQWLEKILKVQDK